jgi:hypothetical protein
VSFQSYDEFREVLGNRTLKATPIGSASKTDRALSASFVDLETGEILVVSAISGALEVGIAGTVEADHLELLKRGA